MYCSLDDMKQEQLNEIEYSRKLYKEQVENVKREERIRGLLHEDYIRSIRSYQTRYDYITSMFQKAQNQRHEKLKKNRPDYEAIKHFIIDDFFNKDKTFKLTNIISCGYESYGWQFEFTGYGKVCTIEIPVKSRLTPKNLEYMHDGMFSFSVQEDSEHYWRVLKKSYEIEEMAKFINEYFELDKKEGE